MVDGHKAIRVGSVVGPDTLRSSRRERRYGACPDTTSRMPGCKGWPGVRSRYVRSDGPCSNRNSGAAWTPCLFRASDEVPEKNRPAEAHEEGQGTRIVILLIPPQKAGCFRLRIRRSISDSLASAGDGSAASLFRILNPSSLLGFPDEPPQTFLAAYLPAIINVDI